MRTIQCAACGVTVTFHQKGPRKYCFDCIPDGDYSVETWKRITGYTPAYNAKRRAEYVPGPPAVWSYPPRACAVCGADYVPVGGSQRYCSKACKTIALTRVCEVEGCMCNEAGYQKIRLLVRRDLALVTRTSPRKSSEVLDHAPHWPTAKAGRAEASARKSRQAPPSRPHHCVARRD